MKTAITVLSILLAGAFLANAQIVPTWERGESHHTDGGWDATVINKTHTAIFTLRDLLDSVDNELAAHSLLRIHQFTEPIKESAKDLDLDSSLNKAKRKKVQGYLHNIARFADGMHDAANRNQMEETLKWHKKLNAEAQLLEKYFGKVYAPPKPVKPMNDGMHHRIGPGKSDDSFLTALPEISLGSDIAFVTPI